MDRLPEIKTVYRKAVNAQSINDFKIEQIDWLIVQIERLREIETAAVAWSKRPGANFLKEEEETNLLEAISQNPRPY